MIRFRKSATASFWGMGIWILLLGVRSHAIEHPATEAELIQQQVEATQSTHGIGSWWQKELVQAEVEINFGGKTVVDGVFIFEANGPRARYDRKQGGSIIYDGKTAWMLDPNASEDNARFHVLTWPWFIMAPFKMKGEGITLSDYQTADVDEKRYHLIKQTFASDMGDAPDDWYRFLIDTKTDRIDSMAYIVTYGKDTTEANKKPSIIRYLEYKNFDGTLISTRYEFWYWDDENYKLSGDKPKAVGSIKQFRYISNDEDLFVVPPGAIELQLPENK